MNCDSYLVLVAFLLTVRTYLSSLFVPAQTRALLRRATGCMLLFCSSSSLIHVRCTKFDVAQLRISNFVRSTHLVFFFISSNLFTCFCRGNTLSSALISVVS